MRSFRRVARLIARLRGRHRFNCLDQDDTSWDDRATAAVALCRRHLGPGRASDRPVVVADLGCGNRRLERALRAGLGRPHEYRGYDLHPQSRRTTRIDLQRELPSRPVDVACALGVLEYLADVPAFLRRLRAFAPSVVVSYTIADCPRPLSPEEREQRGWRTHYTRTEVEALLAEAGYQVLECVSLSEDRTIACMARRRDAGSFH